MAGLVDNLFRDARRSNRLALSCLLGLCSAGSASGQIVIQAEEAVELGANQAQAEVQAMQIQAQEGQAIDVQVLPAEDAEADDLLGVDYQPGFVLPLAEQDVREQVAAMLGFLDAKDWGQAFKLLSEIGESGLDAMVPIGTDGLHMAVRVPLQERLLSMPPEGARAFRLYFDAQAREMLTRVREHPHPGSADQLGLAQRLVDRLMASSIGPEAAELLGDLYFERGAFVRAQRSWRLALDYGSASGTNELRLQTKRAIAMQRSGDVAEAADLYRQLQARYADATLELGGQTVDALDLLGKTIDAAAAEASVGEGRGAPAPIALPQRDALPAWHLRFLDPASAAARSENNGRRGYYYGAPTDLMQHVPPVTADDERVYFHWLGVVFALDRQTGKIAWTRGSVGETARTVQRRIGSGSGDPRNYQIAVGSEALLVVDAPFVEQGGRFILSAFDKQTGKPLWDSNSAAGWALPGVNPESVGTSVLGEVLIDRGVGYAVVCRQGETDCFLRRFDPATGAIDWTLRLGEGDAIVFPYSEIRQLPQPKLLMGDALLYVLTNNGGLVAVDLSAREIAWAMRMQPPVGVGESGNQGRFAVHNNQQAAAANVNSLGGMLIRDGVLYAKEHEGKTLYAMDPLTGRLAWAADRLDPDAHLIDVDDQRFYLMDQHLHSYAIDGEHDLLKKNKVGEPQHGGALIHGEQALVYSPNRLRLLDTQHLDPIQNHESDYLQRTGGRLLRLGDLLVCVSQSAITAFTLETQSQD